MKHHFSLCLLVGWAIFSCLTACSGNDNLPDNTEGSSDGKFRPAESIVRAFESRYPEATQVSWEEENGYYVADFVMNSRTASAWFGANGEWRLGRIPVAYGEVEPIVADAFALTSYAEWEVKEAYTLNRKELVPVYTLNVTNTHTLSNLYFTRNGDFIKVIDDVNNHTDAPVVIPTALIGAINQLYSNVEIADISVIDVINLEISVGLLQDETYLTAIFSKNYNWIVTFRNLTVASLPPAVWAGFNASPYASLPLSRIRAMQSATATTYLFYLIKNNKTMIAEFNSDGRLTTVISRDHVMAKYLLTI
ncbi:MAG: PepSY-like domain-containing protein [Tannerellaceae bacterium]|jgi:hypothetical protein|nr:PepSY-like domain-containing protein [Tannerellaceae bacterium]